MSFYGTAPWFVAASLLCIGCAAAPDGRSADDQFVDDQSADEGTTAESLAHCTKTRHVHIANFTSFTALSEAGSAKKNNCWGSERRTSGFRCDYDASSPDFLKTHEGDAPFASYNEIKPLNKYDATAVKNCRDQSGHPVRTYAAWNGSGWSNEGIGAHVKFAELYGLSNPQAEVAPDSIYAIWKSSYRSSWAPMANISPETSIGYDGVYDITRKLCNDTQNGWIGFYFSDKTCSGGCGVSDWKREAMIKAMNYCTTH